ncbi:hypothetical protein [Blastococcus tunisiensis]|uniref:LysM domain-containing protein n=1 Tax=Blastococcus tunisiensis TaxID=1798228 RepID=A0A1I1WP31_9ACTN|nr:hypothetical protein [Blastococcus sp. DSM 46838]SFD96779.1 hypothetical protein SAMN05216574_101470 [Blastococcus sp. DSM 46838]
MSVRRLLLTAAAMGLLATALAALTPTSGELVDALAAPQRTVDTQGPDALVAAAAALLAWAVWVWGALGLALTAASALPGLLGAAARLSTRAVLPAGARRSAGLLLGLGLGMAGPVTGVGLPLAPLPAAAASGDGVPDWPAAGVPAPGRAPTTVPDRPAVGLPAVAPTSTAVPDWPAGPPAAPAHGAHVVAPGDCLWHITAARLLERTGAPPTDAETARSVHAWWTANADVIGPDPDLLLPGQILRPPEGP